MSNVIVIGGGAAGMMAAVMAARAGHRVRLLEKNEKLGKKIFITGKGRCNLTNACEMQELLNQVVTNRRFLFSAFSSFSNFDTIDFFEELGMRTKIERGNRVFPESDHAYDVTDALAKEMRRRKVTVSLRQEVTGLLTERTEESGTENETLPQGTPASGEPDEKFSDERKGRTQKKKKEKVKQTARIIGVRLKNGSELRADAVVVATGGLSYPSTGSTGDGYRFAKETGHEVMECVPSLVSVLLEEDWCREVSGLSLKNIAVSFKDQSGAVLYEAFGEMLFTHKGVSGPIILSATAEASTKLKNSVMYLDLKPALSVEQLEQRILREIEASRGRQFKGLLGALMPASLAAVLCRNTAIEATRTVAQITREERIRLAEYLKHIPFHVTGLGGYNEAVVTKGGVAVSEVSPSTMESKRVLGLYFVGEVLDLDAMTGGFNLQIAWSTAAACGRNIKDVN